MVGDTEVPEIGRVAQSIAGRDTGRCFVIIEVMDDGYVMVADGSLRKLDRPKKKKLKHLKLKPVVIPIVKERMRSKDRLFDYEIRSHLESLGYNEGYKKIRDND